MEESTGTQARNVVKGAELPVVIAGGGPAGAATAIALSGMGYKSVIVDPGTPVAVKAGESLPPNILHLLQQLDIQHLLQDAAHQINLGNTVVWGSDEVLDRVFLAEPWGNGWHLNRLVFEQQLKSEAERRGAVWMDGGIVTGVEGKQGAMRVSVRSDSGRADQKLDACFVVDASGRHSSVLRSLGVSRHRLDDITAVCAFVTAPGHRLQSTTFVEAVQDGWWYAAPLGGDRVVLNLMTDIGLRPKTGEGKSDMLLRRLKQTMYLHERLGNFAGMGFEEVFAKPAGTSCADRISGDGWLAVGDAACTYDPLSSYGITSAIGGGIYAAYAISDALSGNSHALDAYNHVQQQTFNNCVAMLAHQYRQESRFSEKVFWQRRYL
ncbi:MAG: tryptophan 7-halogenase [Flavipsychrobacter sp.]|nr:tryptophan 7-halogenase [Flavipsychrobacter sp.]